MVKAYSFCLSYSCDRTEVEVEVAALVVGGFKHRDEVELASVGVELRLDAYKCRLIVVYTVMMFVHFA